MDEMTAPAPDMAQPDQDQMQPTGNEASPEEQELYNEFVGRSFLLIYSDKVTDDFLASIKGSKDPVTDIGEFAAAIAFRVVSAASKAGTQIPGDVILNGGAEIVEALVEVAEESGAAQVDEKQMEGAFYAASDKFREMSAGAGGVDQAQAAEDMQIFAEAEKSGQLQQMIGAVEQGGQA